MAFFDDLKQGICDVTKTVCEKSEQFVSIQKLRLKKNSLTNELKATYIEIGKMIYEEKKAGAEFSDAIVQLCQKVDLGLDAIQEVEEQIEEAKARGNVEDSVFDEDDVFEDDVTEIEEEPVEEAEEAAEQVIEEAAEAVEEVMEEAAEAAEEIVEDAAEAVEEAAEAIDETEAKDE